MPDRQVHSHCFDAKVEFDQRLIEEKDATRADTRQPVLGLRPALQGGVHAIPLAWSARGGCGKALR